MRFCFDQGLPAKVIADPPLTVTQTGQTYRISIPEGSLLDGDVWLWQLKSALQGLNSLHTVDAAVSADPNDQFSAKWDGGGRSTLGDAISIFIKATLGWSDSQMSNLYALAAVIT
ncbi:MAG: hypothetical protein JSS66_18940 [Armatimonadetes bacterium]|nr:hypothetical protein [Armatimonadota bacterium]